MNLVFVDGVLFSGDYDGIVKKWDVSTSGKKNKKMQWYGAKEINLLVATNK